MAGKRLFGTPIFTFFVEESRQTPHSGLRAFGVRMGGTPFPQFLDPPLALTTKLAAISRMMTPHRCHHTFFSHHRNILIWIKTTTNVIKIKRFKTYAQKLTPQCVIVAVQTWVLLQYAHLNGSSDLCQTSPSLQCTPPCRSGSSVRM